MDLILSVAIAMGFVIPDFFSLDTQHCNTWPNDLCEARSIPFERSERLKWFRKFYGYFDLADNVICAWIGFRCLLFDLWNSSNLILGHAMDSVSTIGNLFKNVSRPLTPFDLFLSRHSKDTHPNDFSRDSCPI